MRKITTDAINAFYQNCIFKQSNTSVEVSGNETKLLLHGNVIARKEMNGRLTISNCGWFTTTTKERLNGLDGVSIYQKDYEWFLNGKPWDGKPIVV